MDEDSPNELHNQLQSLVLECQAGAIASIFGTDKSGLISSQEAAQSDALHFTHGVKIVFDFGTVIGGLRVNASPGALKALISSAQVPATDDSQVIDMLKEFINQTMGLLKRRLKADNTVGFFLPVVTRQYHDYFFDEFKEKGFEKKYWKTMIDGKEIFCHLWFLIRDSENFEKLLNDQETKTSQGVEFL